MGNSKQTTLSINTKDDEKGSISLFAHTCSRAVDCPEISEKEEIKRRIKAVVEVIGMGYFGVDSI